MRAAHTVIEMKRRPIVTGILYVAWIAFSLAGCTAVVAAPETQSTTPTPDAEAADLIALGQRATQLAQAKAAQARLLQVDTNLVQTSFRFGDAANTNEIYVVVPTQATPSDQWIVQTGPFAKPAPGIDLQSLRVGPHQVAEQMLAQWPACTNLRLTLFGDGPRLEWTGFCDLPEGVVSARVDNDTGVLAALGGPARPPSTATP